ncbi:hypothetical protein FIBSPDRAFT_866918 [Athelia psychrophila]|uniref:Uncharacterized protein n=1 Tax=Athelia psychrophila TaxID=1759441 RepID=A0A166EG89_9AGAM|nr:hypothetical protein FIBSPDRAFT_866918 [Fibularhizoctonia sp. CBS 109695]
MSWSSRSIACRRSWVGMQTLYSWWPTGLPEKRLSPLAKLAAFNVKTTFLLKTSSPTTHLSTSSSFIHHF